MRALRPAFAGTDWTTPVAGGVLTLGAVLAAARVGPAPSIALLVALTLFLALVAGFVAAPHVVVAAAIPLFAFLPALKVIAAPEIGPAKDAVVLAGAAAVALLGLRRVSAGLAGRVDPAVAGLAALLVGLYVLNLGGLLAGTGFDVAWAQGTRLVAEPLVLLVVGLCLDEPRRTARWALASLVATAVAVAAVGIGQQIVGDARLVELGYSYDEQIRTIGGRLRSFGTMDEPFAYAAFLLLALATVLLWLPRRLSTAMAGSVIAVGIVLSYVRSAAIVAVALIGILLARHRQVAPAVLFVGASAAAAVLLLLDSPGATETRTVGGGESVFVTFNGRTEAWEVALGPPSTWAFGRGVGEVGTAAERATFSVTRTPGDVAESSAVDSGYFAAVADVGIVGLLVLLALFGRLAALALAAARRGEDAGWLALAFLAVLLLDAVTRASFTGFPTAFLGLLLVGLVLAAAGTGTREPHPAP